MATGRPRTAGRLPVAVQPSLEGTHHASKNVQPSRLRRHSGSGPRTRPACGGSFAVWAGQPTQPAASTAPTLYPVNMEVRWEICVSTPELIVTAGKPFSIGIGNNTDGGGWRR